MKASETNLQEIIEGTKQYIIPMFQRTYSWRTRQWRQLWDDLLELKEEDSNHAHFIGSIVSIPINASTHGIQQFLVIDGQQRLTTLFILLAATRNIAKEQGNEKLANEIHNTLLINAYKSGEEIYKFLPTQADKDVFKQIIDDDLSEDAKESDIVKAYEFFYRVIKSEDFDVEVLKSIITGNLSLVSIVLSTNDNPYLVFESLNAKGQPLTQADLIRNYLFMRIPANEQENQYTRYWFPMQERLGNQLTEFVRHYLLGINTNVRKNDIYVKFKEKADRQEVIPFLATLSRFASYYDKLLNPELEKDVRIRKKLQRVNEFEVTIAYPFLLYIYRDYEEKKYTVDQFLHIIDLVENYLVRRFVCNIDTKSLSKIFGALYNQIERYDANQSVEEIESYLQNRSYPKDFEFVVSLQENHFYGSGDRTKKGKFILNAIETSYAHKEGIDLIESKISVEHIMPQTLNDVWRQELGEDAETIHAVYLHRLGNLTLTGYNSELSNKPFSGKREYFQGSNYEMNKEIALQEQWTVECMIDRTNDLIGKIKEIWPYFGKEENEIKSIKGTSPRLLVFLERTYELKSWRDLMHRLLMGIYEDNREGYQKVMDKYPRFLSTDNSKMAKNRQLENGHYIEVNLNAEIIYKQCENMLKCAGYTKEDWHLEVEEK